MPTIAASGALSTAEAVGGTTLTVVAPTIGYLRVFVSSLNGTVAVSSVAGGGVGTWANAVINSDATNGFRTEIWWGVVTSTSTSPTTITVTWASSVSSADVEFVSQMYSSNLTSPRWLLDTTGTSRSSSATALAYPTLAPTYGSELYFGYVIVAQTGSAGSTAGFSYSVTPSFTNVVCYNVAVTASTSPAATQSPAGSYDAIGAMFAVRNRAAFFMTGV